MYEALDDLQQFFHHDCYALVAQQLAHGVEVMRTNKTFFKKGRFFTLLMLLNLKIVQVTHNKAFKKVSLNYDDNHEIIRL